MYFSTDYKTNELRNEKIVYLNKVLGYIKNKNYLKDIEASYKHSFQPSGDPENSEYSSLLYVHQGRTSEFFNLSSNHGNKGSLCFWDIEDWVEGYGCRGVLFLMNGEEFAHVRDYPSKESLIELMNKNLDHIIDTIERNIRHIQYEIEFTNAHKTYELKYISQTKKLNVKEYYWDFRFIQFLVNEYKEKVYYHEKNTAYCLEENLDFAKKELLTKLITEKQRGLATLNEQIESLTQIQTELAS